MDYLPVFMDVTDRRVLLVGGGDTAARKAALLLRAGARVRVVAPWLCDALAQLRAQGGVEHDADSPSAAHMHDACMVFVATDDAELNCRVSALAKSLMIPVNVVDAPRLCTFIMPAIVDRSPVLVAVSSAGASPVLATMIRARIEAMLEPGIGRVAQWAGRWRERVKGAIDGTSARREWWQRVLRSPLADAVAAGNERAADAHLQALLGAAAAREPKPLLAGRVALIGAGPGRADLLTLRAARLLGEADVIVHDGEVADEVLELARRDAQRIDVSNGRSIRRMGHANTCELLIQLAGEGRRIVRINSEVGAEFGRVGGEASALAGAGLTFEVVPGIGDAANSALVAALAPAVAA